MTGTANEHSQHSSSEVEPSSQESNILTIDLTQKYVSEAWPSQEIELHHFCDEPASSKKE